MLIVFVAVADEDVVIVTFNNARHAVLLNGSLSKINHYEAKCKRFIQYPSRMNEFIIYELKSLIYLHSYSGRPNGTQVIGLLRPTTYRSPLRGYFTLFQIYNSDASG